MTLHFRFALILVALSSVGMFGCAGLLAFGADQGDASATIAAVENELAASHYAVLEADGVGADVSDLLDRLNSAAEFLVEAKTCYRSANSSGAIYFAELASGNLDGLIEQADERYASVALERAQTLPWVAGGSVMGGFIVVLVGFFGWGYAKRYYLRRFLGKKPEVSDPDKP